MRTRKGLTGAASVFFAMFVATQLALAADTKPSFAGTWEGSANNLPAIQLQLDDSGGKIGGVIVFYFQQRPDLNSPWHVAGESSGPVLAPQVEGNTLTFATEHHKCHGCAELGPNVKFRMELRGPDEARLWNLSAATDSDPGLKLVRRTGTTARAAQKLQAGVSVEMAVTRAARPMPEADNEDALVVAVTAGGDTYLGIKDLSPAALAEEAKDRLAKEPGKKVYIKADARTSYAAVIKVLEALHSTGIGEVALLTNQRVTAQPGHPVPPMGLDVSVGSPSASAPVVEVIRSAEGQPALKVNDQPVASAAFPKTLANVLQNQSEKEVVVKAEATLPFDDVVNVIDASRSTGAKVVLAVPGQ